MTNQSLVLQRGHGFPPETTLALEEIEGEGDQPPILSDVLVSKETIIV
jgi:hypothetical protein